MGGWPIGAAIGFVAVAAGKFLAEWAEQGQTGRDIPEALALARDFGLGMGVPQVFGQQAPLPRGGLALHLARISMFNLFSLWLLTILFPR